MTSINKPVRVGIVGTGYIANYHMEVIKKLRNVQVHSVFDVIPHKSVSFANKWNIPNAYSTLDDFITKKPIDVAHVLVPPNHHYPVAKALLESNLSVILEKPMAETTQECQELIRIAKRNGVALGLNQNSLFHPMFVKLLGDINRGAIGKVHQVVSFQSGPLGQLDAGMFGHWMFRKPANVLLEQGPHPIAQVLQILGGVREIYPNVSGRRELGHEQIFYDRWQCTVNCERGSALLHISFGDSYFPQSWMEVSGQDGSIRVDLLRGLYLKQAKSIFPDYLDPLANAVAYGSAVVRGKANFGDYVLSKLGIRGKRDSFFISMKKSIDAFYSALAENRPVPVSGDYGAEIIEFCEKWSNGAGIAAFESHEKNVLPKSDNKAEVFITGATGFLGRKLVQSFVEKGVSIRVMVRSIQGLPTVFFNPLVEIIKGDLNDLKKMREAVSGIKAIYHLAHSIASDWKEFSRINIQGTRILAKAALSAGVEKFIFTSTIAVYDYGSVSGAKVTENTQIDQEPNKRNLYARSKIQIEEMLFKMVQQKKLPLVLFRPGIVVGEGGAPYHSGVGQWTRDNTCAYWGRGGNPLPFVLVEDVCSALIKAMKQDGIEGEAFNLIGDIRFSARAYIDWLRKYSKRKIYAFQYPTKLCFMSDCFKFFIKALTGSHKDALLSYKDLANRSIQAEFENEKPKRLLGWEPCDDPEVFAEKGIGWSFNK